VSIPAPHHRGAAHLLSGGHCPRAAYLSAEYVLPVYLRDFVFAQEAGYEGNLQSVSASFE
jgi:hypothetical protein